MAQNFLRFRKNVFVWLEINMHAHAYSCYLCLPVGGWIVCVCACVCVCVCQAIVLEKVCGTCLGFVWTCTNFEQTSWGFFTEITFIERSWKNTKKELILKLSFLTNVLGLTSVITRSQTEYCRIIAARLDWTKVLSLLHITLTGAAQPWRSMPGSSWCTVIVLILMSEEV